MQLNDLQPATKNGQILAAAWTDWRGAKALPSRSDMRLEDITGILPWITLIDVISETEIIIRLAGTMVREIMGVELTGRNLLELTEPEHRAARGVRTAQTAQQPCGAIWIWDIAFEGQARRPAENLSLPLQPDEDGRPPQMLNVFGMLDDTNTPQAMGHLQQLASAEKHSFIDIGAGIPAGYSPDH